MASSLLLSFLVLGSLLQCSHGSDEQPLSVMSYHKGALLSGRTTVNFIWYGKFAAAQRDVLTDFIASLSSIPAVEPSVATWWNQVRKMYPHPKKRFPTLTVGEQIHDPECSLGKRLTDDDLVKLASRGAPSYAINVVVTADDVVVDGFCRDRCGTHGASPRTKSVRFAYIWVGNSATQCPGYCAWPFHQPEYGPNVPPLGAPNNDIGADGMAINLAASLAGAVTNPFGGGYYQGPKEAPLEAATACTGVYGKGAYPGYAGDLLVDATTRASYNANGANGRKYLVPALFDPATSSCSTLV